MRKIFIFSILFASFLVLLSLNVIAPVAANCGGSTACRCGYTLNESRTLNSSDILTGCNLVNGLNIGADNIILDCNGSSISATGNNNNGINVNGYNNITIKNCNIDYFDSSIYVNNSLHNTLLNNTVDHAWNGIHLENSNYNVLSENTVINGHHYGFYITHSNYNNLTFDNVLAMNYGTPVMYSIGIALENGEFNLIDSCFITSTDRGISLYALRNTTVVNNNASGNTGGGASNFESGIFIYGRTNGSVISDNNFMNNGKSGIWIHDIGNNNNAIYHNNIYGNSVNNIYSAMMPLEVSNSGEGNYWGHSCPTLFTGTDSNNVTVTDSNPYNESNGWLLHGPGCGGAPAISCGDTINTTTTLTGNLPNCTGNGLVISASNIVLDCDGHSISGDGSSTGITVMTGLSNVTVKAAS